MNVPDDRALSAVDEAIESALWVAAGHDTLKREGSGRSPLSFPKGRRDHLK